MAQQHFTWYVHIYGSLQNATVTPETPITELEAMVTAGTAFKMKVGILGLDPDEDFDGDIVQMAGGVMIEEFDVYEIYNLMVFPFRYSDAEAIASEEMAAEDRWDENDRRALLKIMRYPFKWLDMGTYPNEPWFPTEGTAMAFVRENHSTNREGKLRFVEFDIRKRQPEDDL